MDPHHPAFNASQAPITSVTVAERIRDIIGADALLAIGAKHLVALPEGIGLGFRFRVGQTLGKALIMEDNDGTYRVHLYAFSTYTYTVTTDETTVGVTMDELSWAIRQLADVETAPRNRVLGT